MTSKEKYALLDKLGLCYECHKAKQFGKWKYCPECLEKIAERNARARAKITPEDRERINTKARERYWRCKQEGLCPLCSKPATHGMYCYEHSIAVKKRGQERTARSKQERHDKGLIPDYRVANRLCRSCGAPIEDGNETKLCNACRARMSRIAQPNVERHIWRDMNARDFGREKYKPIGRVVAADG